MYAKKEKIYPAYVSKKNSYREKQVILLMISNEKGRDVTSGGRWHYLAVTKLSALLREITSRNNGKFYCLNCLHSFRTKNKLESHEKVCKNKSFCNVIMPSEEKIDGCKNNPENSSTAIVTEHIPSGFSMSIISSFKGIENEHDI